MRPGRAAARSPTLQSPTANATPPRLTCTMLSAARFASRSLLRPAATRAAAARGVRLVRTGAFDPKVATPGRAAE
eukprot:366088-Chlamydomonas_euryale.AAC.12